MEIRVLRHSEARCYFCRLFAAAVTAVQRRDSPGNEERSKLWSNGNNERFVVRERGHDRVWWKC
jgi:hypothetical protein